MNCDKIQDILLTDYLDGQINDAVKRKVETHLTSCVTCREFLAYAQKTIIEPFDQAQKIDPPETIWQNIQEQISQEQEIKTLTPWWKKILDLSLVRQPAYALTLSVLVVLSVFYLIQRTSPSMRLVEQKADPVVELTAEETYIFDQLAFMSEDETAPDDEESYEETDIEKYFL